MHVPFEIIESLIAHYFYPFCRISSMLMVMPVFSNRALPMQVRLLISILITAAAVPSIHIPNVPTLLSYESIIMIMNQIILGMAIGFVLNFVIQAFVIAGQILSMQSGLSYATMMDPANGGSVPIISEFYQLMAVLVFLSLDSHLAMIQLITTSFQALPLNATIYSNANIGLLLYFMKYVFELALLISLPLVISLLLVNIGFGIITRATPQINIFSLSLPLGMLVTLFLIYLTYTRVMIYAESGMDVGLNLMNQMVH